MAELLYNGDFGGGPRSVRDLAFSLNRSLLDIHFYFLRDGSWLGAQLREKGFTVTELNWSGGPSISLRYRLVKALQDFAPDIIHDHSLPMLTRLWLRLFFPRSVMLTSEHFPHQLSRRANHQWLAYGINWLEYAVLNKVITHSRYVTRVVTSTYCIAPSKIAMLPLGIDLHEFDPRRPEFQLNDVLPDNENTFLIGYVGRLSCIDKGVDDLPRIAKRLVDQGFTGFEILIAGDGPDRKFVTDIARQLAVENKLRFVGWQSEVPKFLSQLDLILVPSRMETFGLTIIEALSMGVRVVAYDVGGLSETASDCNDVLLVPSRDIDKFTKAIVTCIENFGKSRSIVSRDIIAPRNNCEYFSQAFERLLFAEINNQKRRHLVPRSPV
ncbi:MAG TPA: glycosyltransferase family 4 protein [Prolixibacteraceae bacterium]